MSYEFTSDEEIAGFRTGDKFVDITGFVDVINNIKSVNIKGQPSWLFAVILNNNSKVRMRVIFWGDKAQEFLLEILGGNLSTSNPKFHNPKDNIHILEFNYQDSSKMITHGLFVQPEITHIDYQNVELENLLKTKIKYSEVKAYLKSMLLMEEGEKSHGLGKIVDHKENYVLVEIVDYPKEDERLKIGVAVKMRGVIYDDQSEKWLNGLEINRNGEITGYGIQEHEKINEAERKGNEVGIKEIDEEVHQETPEHEKEIEQEQQDEVNQEVDEEIDGEVHQERPEHEDEIEQDQQERSKPRS
ncbi:hypothetical protein HCN44_000335 [Aphidius gifuensis]|uniref:Uncharacterized protein n=1 Tax=Aphidius gifuensis TaxID=684658 RepID=A0A835CRS6_APHGI|nr:hypothetical protein HCN44_000335 [Aphidius gifuensis]